MDFDSNAALAPRC